MTPGLLKAISDLFRAYRDNDPLMIQQTRNNLKWWYQLDRMRTYCPQVTKQ